MHRNQESRLVTHSRSIRWAFVPAGGTTLCTLDSHSSTVDELIITSLSPPTWGDFITTQKNII
eukprot:13025098-Ditylum_brightwellii.AAC.1